MSAIHYTTGHFGPAGKESAIKLVERTGSKITQISFFASQLSGLNRWLAEHMSASLPAIGTVEDVADGVLARVEPGKIWHISKNASGFEAAPNYFPLDMSASRRCLDITGPAAADLFARLAVADIRLQQFAENGFLTTGIHHVPVQVMRIDGGLRLFVPRSFSRSLFDLAAEVGAQFGMDIHAEAAY